MEINDGIINFAIEIYNKAHCEGYRGLFNLINCAKAICALDGKRKVRIEDIIEASDYTLKHRKNEEEENPPKAPQNEENSEENQNEENNSDENDKSEQLNDNTTNDFNDENLQENSEDRELRDIDEDFEAIIPDEIYKTIEINDFRMDRMKRKGSGRRLKVRSSTDRGRIIGTKRQSDNLEDINFLETIKAGILDGAYDREYKRLNLKEEHLRENHRKKRIGASIVFLLDTSASMNVNKRMLETKNAILSLLTDSYVKRDEVALIVFSGADAEIILPFTRSPEMAKRELTDIRTKGRTPLSIGLYKALELVKMKLKKNREALPIIFLISDGRANSGKIFSENPIEDAKTVAELIHVEGINSVVIDTEDGFIKLGIPKEIAMILGAKYYRLEEIKADKISGIVRDWTDYSISRVDIGEA